MATDNTKECGSPDNWNLWSKVYSDRDMRMKLYCRDPEERTPYTSNTLVVRNINLECPPRAVVELFAKFGPIESSGFPAVMRHYQCRYCFIKFREIRDAVRACTFYNGYELRGRVLEVVHYDSAYKYCKLAERSKNIQLKNASEENIVGYVRQAHLQAEFRAAKFRQKQNICQKQTVVHQEVVNNSNNAASIVSNEVLEIVQEEEFSPDTDNYINNDMENLLDEEENRSKKHVKSVDDVGLESDTGFWNWLNAKLKFTGPLHYTHPEIGKAVHKLPQTVRRQFDWLLGLLRAAEEFKLIGPYICLDEHSYWAKEMCFVARLDYKVPFKEMWEPLHPSEIKNDKQLIKYVRALLIQFGPLSLMDSKIVLLLRSLPVPLLGDPTYSPDGLCRMLESNSLFVVDKDVYYLSREHEHLLGRARVQQWRVEESSPVNAESKDSGCGTSTKSNDTF